MKTSKTKQHLGLIIFSNFAQFAAISFEEGKLIHLIQ
jgi:hypothetical protein